MNPYQHPALALEAIRRRRQAIDPERLRAGIVAKLEAAIEAAIAGQLPPADPATFTGSKREIWEKLQRLADTAQKR